MSLCLSVYISEKPHVQISPNLLYVTRDHGRQYVLRTSGFVDDVMFP